MVKAKAHSSNYIVRAERDLITLSTARLQGSVFDSSVGRHGLNFSLVPAGIPRGYAEISHRPRRSRNCERSHTVWLVCGLLGLWLRWASVILRL